MPEVGQAPENTIAARHLHPEQQIVRNERDSVLSPSKNLQAIYVVPIRGEVRNGNFFLQIKDFTNQRGVSTDMYEVIYARNNKPKDVEEDNQSYKDNQTILSTIKYIQGVTEEIPEGLEEWQLKIIKSAKYKKLQVQTFDVPADLLSNDDITNNIERSRVTGENLAVQRFKTIQSDGAIVMMDADTRVGIDSTGQIKEQLVDQPSTGLLRIHYDLIPGEGGAKVFQTASQQRFANSMILLNKALGTSEYPGWYAIKALSLGTRDPYDISVHERDYLRPLQGDTKSASGIRLYTQDRARSEEVGGKFGSMRYDTLDRKNDTPPQLQHPAFSIVIGLYEQFPNDPRIKTQTIEILKEYFSDEQWLSEFEEKIRNGESVFSHQDIWNIRDQHRVSPKDYAEATYHIFRKLSRSSEPEFERYALTEVNRERFRHNYIIGTVKRLIEKTYAGTSELPLTVGDLQEIEGKETLQANFLTQNSWILEALQQVRATKDTAEEAFVSLQEEFPEYLSTFEDTTYTYANALILGVTRFVDEVRLHPNNFSDTAHLLIPPR